MTGKERMLTTLRFVQPDRPPHFEAMFELEKEALGLQFPDQRFCAIFGAKTLQKLGKLPPPGEGTEDRHVPGGLRPHHRAL